MFFQVFPSLFKIIFRIFDSLNWINNFLRQIKQDGSYDRIHDKWFKKNDWLKEME